MVTVGLALFFASCSGGTRTTMTTATQPGAGTATINLHVSDPATCSAPQGQFSHILLTISDVLIHQSASAGPNDAGWVDLTPNLKNAPVQVDMLGQATNQCFLASLGSMGIQPGSYQQIRVMLADNSSNNIEGNRCGGTANCVILTSDPTNTPHPLLLSSESKTGIKIPSGQLAGGQFTVGEGQVKDLDIDFNACASILEEGNGQFRLKPVLHAGEVSIISAAISGTVLDGATKKPIIGNIVVALEQRDVNNVDRVIMETGTDANGTFALCPVPAGTYDLVVSAINAAGTAYAATVITGVQPGDSLGSVPLTAAALPASIKGQITSSTGAAATVADLDLSALQPITVNATNVLITTPLPQFPAATATLVTAPGAACPANTDCVSYTLAVPAANPSVGAFVNTGSQVPAPPAAGTVNYTMDALAFVPGSAGVADCVPSDVHTSQTSASTPLTASPGTTVTAATLAFTKCQ